MVGRSDLKVHLKVRRFRAHHAAFLAAVVLLTVGVAASGDGGATASNQGELQKRRLAQAEVGEAGAGNAELAFFAQQTRTGEVLVNRGGNRQINPGAVGDVVLGAQILAVLKPEFRFRTNYWAGGRVRQGTIWGDLIVEGFGDPTINDARLKWVARQLALGGVQRITGLIRLDDAYFSTGGGIAIEEKPGDELEPTSNPDAGQAGAELTTTDSVSPLDGGMLEPGLGLEDVNDDVHDHAHVHDRADAKTAGALTYNSNRATLIIKPSRVGTRAAFMIDPDVGHLRVFPYVETAPFNRRLRSITTSTAAGTSVIVTGALAANSPPRRLEIKIGSSSFYFGHALYRHLVKNGVRVRRRLTTVPTEVRRRWLITDSSPPLVELLAAIFHGDLPGRGQATMEALVRTIAVGASGDDGDVSLGLARLRDRLVDEVGLKRNSFTLPSPLGRPGSLSPQQIVKVLTAIDQRYELSADLSRAIGPAATQRLLSGRFGALQMRSVRAVADEVAGQLTLAGYVKSTQGPVAFALVVRGAGASEALWKAALQALTEIAPQRLSAQPNPASARAPVNIPANSPANSPVNSRNRRERGRP